jgi:uncharacterized protein YcfJ
MRITSVLVVAGALLSAGCVSVPRDDPIVYGGLGGLTGAAVGSAIAGREGAVVGGVLGAVAGVSIANRERDRYRDDDWYDSRDSKYYRRDSRHDRRERRYEDPYYADRRSRFPDFAWD